MLTGTATNERSHRSAEPGKRRLAALAVALLAPAAAQAEYRLDVGDALEISVTGIPDLKQRVTVGPDGEITYPLIGQMHVSGLDVSEVRASLRRLLPTKVFQQRNGEGREVMATIRADEVLVSVVEYRPVYVAGDVGKPGEQPFRPGITVRQAIAVAGGYDLNRLGNPNPLMALDLRGDYETLWADLAKEQARAARLKAELEGNPQITLDLEAFPLPQPVKAGILQAAQETLRARQSEYDKQKTFFRLAAEQAETQAALFTDKQRKEEEGLQLDTADLDRYREAFQKGNLPLMRMTEMRRGVLLGSTGVLQTIAQVQLARKEQSDRTFDIEKLDAQRQVTLLQELEDANAKIVGLRARLEATADKLLYAGTPRSALTGASERNKRDGHPESAHEDPGAFERIPSLSRGDRNLCL
jgi:polysaccharide biosynthesis/export protein